VFNVIDHSGVAERVGVQMPDSKLLMFGKPAVGAAVMLAAPLAALDIPLKVLVWEDRNGAVSVSYNSPGFLAERHHLEGALRAPFDAVESIVEALVRQQHFVVISLSSLVVAYAGAVLVVSSPVGPGPGGGAARGGGCQVCQETADLRERDRDEAAARAFGAFAAVTAR